ncbi:metastasis-associated protein MTA3-like isoform X2 [Gigantopelta aegis]|uniref:metastasis-associated protein MTA3-like isoform X2 n=1 Tax=Gigantopelta aegis TaxID=1735272 RepID=UPI001B88CEE2|nr:metastasis-associated protein MTA3-like isoform X2 [Gigantopelta aegis]
MAANMYRVGDYVYFETSSTSPYQIRRIEELNKTPNGNVEAKVMCFYRRRDISSSLIMLADKHQSEALLGHKLLQEEDGDEEPSLLDEFRTDFAMVPMEEEEPPEDMKTTEKVEGEEKDDHVEKSADNIPDKQKHQLKHRELFLSRQVETLPATHIRGKCVVTLLNETELLISYLNKDDTFFYSLVYDPQQKTLLADKGEIRVGSKYQAETIPLLQESEDYDRQSKDLEELVWEPDKLSEKEIDQFQIISRSVGTFARALDCTSTVRQPSLHMSAAAASRDITLFHAMNTLHTHKYNIANAVSSLVPEGGPVLCRDEMEEWSASEANLFEEALDKYGKDFNDIRQDFLPWKSLKSIVEYYYMWKTTDRYVQQKRIKAAEAESKLKQVYIPNYNKPNPAALSNSINGTDNQVSGRACESCYTAHSSQWYSWGPAHMQCRLCAICWTYWKKYGGLKMPTRLDGERPAPNQRQERVAQREASRSHRCTISGCGKDFKLKVHLARHLATAHGLAIRSGSPRPVMKTRAAFCLVTTPLTRISRRMCKDILRPRHAARCPFVPINIAAIKQECPLRLTDAGCNVPTIPDRKAMSTTMDPVASRLGINIQVDTPNILLRSAADPSVKGQGLSFPVSSMLPQSPRNSDSPKPVTGPSIMKKRGYQNINGLDGPLAKKPSLGVIRQASSALDLPEATRASVINHNPGRHNGRTKNPGRTGYKMHMISWIDAPDDVFFVATDATRKLRKQLNPRDFKRTARNPWRGLLFRPPLTGTGSRLPNTVVLD